MSISWNEIKTRAAAPTFENDFFHIFGVERSRVAVFEQRVKVGPGSDGYIDLFWKGHIIVEMKSPGKDMERAYRQAKDYANALDGAALPKCILVCDFNQFHHYDLEDGAKRTEFPWQTWSSTSSSSPI